ncbi:MAG: precorrin-6y C5,15-methyltransferase (decarboxylating) subunit CbiE [Nitrospiraceae bacterium]|nr:MAG: precorrin-6y C5,15-methyltransferase (decarboxylating) subunit CbiE [Nitrospiraceae bacterium]
MKEKSSDKIKEMILLIGHGSRAQEKDGIEQTAKHLHGLIHPGCKKGCVQVAYLQFMKPSISEAIEDMAGKGATGIIVHPYFLTGGTHVRKGIPEEIKKSRKRYPEVDFIYTEPLGSHKKLAEVVLARMMETAPAKLLQIPERGTGTRENKIHIIGIGYRPLDNRAKEAVLCSDIILATDRLRDVFRRYEEFNMVRDKIKILKDIHETERYIQDNYRDRIIALLADGDPLFFGIGGRIMEKTGKDPVLVYPDLSSVQVAFSRINETWKDAFLISLHGGPDPAKRRKLEYELNDIPSLLAKHDKIAILTDKVNTPEVIAKLLHESSALPHFRTSALQMFVCEKLGYPEEKITSGTAEQISELAFSYPNVVIILKR